VTLGILSAVAAIGLGAVMVWTRFLLDELGQPGPGWFRRSVAFYTRQRRRLT
jgi:hypothetical protein